MLSLSWSIYTSTNVMLLLGKKFLMLYFFECLHDVLLLVDIRCIEYCKMILCIASLHLDQLCVFVKLCIITVNKQKHI